MGELMNTINGRTPEEIRNGLRQCGKNTWCDGPDCPYYEIYECHTYIAKDALALINQLLEDKKQLERERDAAVEQLRGQCEYCANVRDCGRCEEDCDECPCDMCYRGDNWQWCGVPEAE